MPGSEASNFNFVLLFSSERVCIHWNRRMSVDDSKHKPIHKAQKI